MIQSAINQVVAGDHLTESEAAEVMLFIMEGKATPAQIAAFMTALRMKGETVDEIVGCAKAMRERAALISPKSPMLVDTCGTGGDGANTFNVSTAAAFVIAGAGVSVAKHGNRSVSSRSGSADVLEALGVNIDLPVESVETCIDRVGIGFMFAPRFHASMKHAVTPRKEVGIRSIFNVLGPLTNPACAHVQVVGVYDPALTETLAEVLGRLGVSSAYVVHGMDLLDELSISAETQVTHLKDGQIETFYVHPQDVGLQLRARHEIQGGDPVVNAQIIRSILDGEDQGARRDIVLLNASAALVATGVAQDFVEGIKLAADTIDRGLATEKLQELIDYTRSQVAS